MLNNCGSFVEKRLDFCLLCTVRRVSTTLVRRIMFKYIPNKTKPTGLRNTLLYVVYLVLVISHS
jgi:hypothetical protein